MYALKRHWMLALMILGSCRSNIGPNEASQAMPLGGAKRAAFDETKGYLHRPSGVGFVYPADWQHEEAQGEPTDTSLALSRAEFGIVTVFWTQIPAVPPDLGEQKYSELREIYHDKVGKAKPATAAGQAGYEFPIECGPMGDDSTYRMGVDYVFPVRREKSTWLIELRASARDATALKAAKSLLADFRMN